MSRILLIEEELSSQLLCKSRLADVGHEVVVAPTGGRGLVEARGGGFDLFLVDVALGSGIDGFEVCKRIKTIPQVHGIPVVLISREPRSREDIHKGYEAGCDAFLAKSELPLLEDVVRAMLNIKALQDDLASQNQLLEEQNRRLTLERQRGADLEVALRESGERSLVFKELAAGRPDGLLLVDAEGVVRFADRGAIEVLGKDLEGRNLGSLAPSSGLEAFVRDARNDPREGYRFDILRAGKVARSLSASVLPIVPVAGRGESGLRAVLLLDAGRRRIAAETLRLQEQGVVRRELGPLLEAARLCFHPSRLLGRSEVMRVVRRQVIKAARADASALVRGGPGVGKELVARVLHFGGRRSGPFVPINCAALAVESLEAELFGHVKGAFDGALSDRPGLVHQAHLGTLFLDEVQALPPELQSKIARALRDGEVYRVGSQRPEFVDLRVVAATRASRRDALLQGALHDDLFAQLSVDLYLPPLREREGDVEHLAQSFLPRFAPDREGLDFAGDALAVLERYGWPGNVRELENCVERACALAEGERIQVADLPQALREVAREAAPDLQIPARRPDREIAGTHTPAERPLDGVLRPADGVLSLEYYERMCILDALEQTRGDKVATAKLLNVAKSTFYRKLKEHKIT